MRVSEETELEPYFQVTCEDCLKRRTGTVHCSEIPTNYAEDFNFLTHLVIHVPVEEYCDPTIHQWWWYLKKEVVKKFPLARITEPRNCPDFDSKKGSLLLLRRLIEFTFEEILGHSLY